MGRGLTAGTAPRWFIRFGVAAALLLGVLMLSGSLSAIEAPLSHWLDGPPQVGMGQRLPADQLLRRIEAARPGRTVESLTIWHEPSQPMQAELAPARPGDASEIVNVDPSSGRVLATTRARAFFSGLRAARRGLPVRIAASAGLLLLAGVCVAAAPRTLRAGPVALASLMLASATVLLQMAAVLAASAPSASAFAPATPSDGEALTHAWPLLDKALGGRYEHASLRLPARAGAPLRFEFSEPGAAPDESSRLEIDPDSGEATTLLRYADLAWAERARGSIPAWADGSAGGAAGQALAALAALLLPFATLRLLRLPAANGREQADDNGPAVLVAYASQTGTAESLARRSAELLRAGGVPARLEDLAALSLQELREVRRALFVVATTGSGEAPDHVRPFLRQMRGRPPALDLRYGLLALGDIRYEAYCGFGRTLFQWLRHSGAQPLFSPIDVDRGNPAALARWRSELAVLGASVTDTARWHEPSFKRWRLLARRHLNPGSAGLACFHLELAALERHDAQWQAGDIAEIRCGEAVREYSIASLPEDGAIHLLVRQARREDGSLGVGSGWLTDRLAVGSELALRIRGNAGFHAPPDERPLILIGNGTGLAGLRAHLRARVRAGHRRNWLIFGERQQAHDYFHRDEIEAWQRDGHLERLDLAFSRDQPQRVYVQHRLHAAGDVLLAWLADGAAIYVCGSSVGMAPEVEAVLIGLIGEPALDVLVGQGRYRRDVY